MIFENRGRRSYSGVRLAKVRTLLFIFPLFLQAAVYDTVIRNGRVMDPESGLDAVRSVGILNGRIAEISSSLLEGRRVIDASGLVIAPGFIDLHSHGQTPENYRFKARDGVTTALELEVGASPVAAWYEARKGKSLINFGASSGHLPARMASMGDSGTFLPRDGAVTRAATADEQSDILGRVRRGLQEGAPGVGMGIAYVPLVARGEVLDLFRLAAEFKVPVFVHMRNAGPVEPGAIDALQEAIADAAVTGAAVHVVHITSMAFRETPLALQMIAGARARGLDITTEAYSYTAGMTRLETAIFDAGWQERLGIGFGDLQWVATGERLNALTFANYRKAGGLVILHSIPEPIVRMVMADPSVIIASDGLIDDGKGHPRGAGCFARLLGRYVREEKALDLMTALRKITLLPAMRIGLTQKGRIRVGADADLTIFDPATVSDLATYEQPALYSTGIPWVMVNGEPVVERGELKAIAPGRGVLRRK